MNTVTLSTPTQPRLGRSTACVVGLSLWLAALVGWSASFTQYKGQAGSIGAVAEHWPTACGLEPASQGPTLLMFVHPRCPCSRASLAELEMALPRLPVSRQVTVVFYSPLPSPAGWRSGDIVERAAAIEGLATVWDEGSTLATRFGAQTSGHVLLYDPSGRLRFTGGITPARGHEGDNRGRALLEQAAAEDRSEILTAAVYGCPIVEKAPHDVARNGT